MITRHYGGLIATALLLAGCVGPGALTAPPGAESSGTASADPASQAATPPPVSSPTAFGNCGTATEWVDYAPYTIASLAAGGHVFVQGVATGYEPGLFNTTDGKPPRGWFMRHGAVPDTQENGHIYTPVVLRVDQVFAGDVKAGSLRAFIEGGTVGCWTVRLSGAPTINLNEPYVLALRTYFLADGTGIPGQYYVVFSWPIDAEGVVQTPEGPMSLAALAQVVAKAAPAPSP